MRTMLMSTAIVGALSLGMAMPASAQVVLEFGTPETRNDVKAERIERKGAARAEEAAERGNYRRAAKIKRNSERRADRVDARDGQTRDENGVIRFNLN